ncbi:MAG: alcohol dehydrogenase [Bacillaceae bacterium]|jgi:2-desacetyl-2-hydroxyethyl bacteriochlorophyllide A dehydrogenase|uniref:zinc-dependent alcohol dehydrogenase family protein n=1 Tax=Caldibacillus debilis TaxID=301148 RepID=UPI0003702B29|nr:zinc-dependent alcohol dehydrogenase family protein [Caldibacillus debilis]MBY6271224.1 alcohol dehydrogenase [Bacillaceae bacterium]
MKAAVYYGPEDIRVEETGLRDLGKNELLIKVKACGICGTDIHIYRGEKGSTAVTPPVILGHEFSGEVVEVGEGVEHFSPGDRVAVDPNIYCGECSYCQSGKKQLCRRLNALGVSRNGGFAEYCIVPAANAVKMPETVPYEAAALTEPLSCCLHGIDRAGISPGQKVAVIGGGAIGLIMTQLALLSGASSVMVSEPVKKRRELALQLGADRAADPVHETVEADQFDVVIECAGNRKAMETALKAAKRGGTVLFFSVPSPDEVLPVRPFDIYEKELTIKGSFINPSTFLRAADLIAHRRIKLEPIITHAYPVEDIKTALAMQSSPDAVKVLIRFD